MTDSKNRLTRKDVFPFILLGILCLYVFRDILFRGHLLFGTDFFSFYLGMKQFLYDEIHGHHTLPGWNPFVFGGIPFWAHLESTIFYPLDLLFWFMPAERAYGYTVALHVYLAGAFMYLFCRSLAIPAAGALVGALCFMFSGMMMATLYDGQMFRIQAFTWIPLILFLLHRSLSLNGALLPSLMAGFFWGIQIMSGAPQDALYTLVAALVFTLFLWNWNFRSFSSGLRPARTLAILVLVGLGVAAVQIVPSYEFIRESVRGAMKQYSVITMGSYPPEGIITWLLPHFYGRFAENKFWVSDIPWSVPLYNLYVGVLPVYLLFFLSPGESGSRRTTVFALSLGLLCFVLALGSNTPLYEFIVMLPGFDKVRAPSKIIILWVLAMALLAGMGMDGLLRLSKGSLRRRLGMAFGVLLSVIALDAALHAERALTLKLFSPFFLDQAIPGQWGFAETLIRSEWHRFTILSAIIVFVILVSVRGRLSMPLAASLLCALLFLDLAYVNRGAVRHDDRIYAEAGRVKEELGAALGQDKTVFRVGSSKSGWGANFEMVLGLQSVGGYNPLFLQRYYEYVNQYRFHGRPVPEGWIVFFYEERDHPILMDLLNVKYVISHETRSLGLRETHRPRAFLVHRAEFLEKKEAILDALIQPGFDPTEVVFFEKGTPPLKAPLSGKASAADPGTVTIVTYRPDSIALSVHSVSAALLFLSEVYYPGWKAYVDGQATEILRGNYLFRVLEVPEGQHEVRLVFDPWTTKAGTGITLLTLLLILALPVFRKLKTRVPAARRPHSFAAR